MTELSKEEQELEWLKCELSYAYFLDKYVQIYDKALRQWIPFHLWKSQYHVLQDFIHNRLVAVLKARQLGLSWLALAYGLAEALFKPISKIGIFSKRDDEAQYLLGDERLKGMYNRLPGFLQARAVLKSSGHEFELSNGSVFRAFPTTAGDSYALTLAILDEFDLVPDQNRLMRSVQPTIEGGGQMLIISRVDKSRPQTEFKRIYRGGKAGLTDWKSTFLPWYAHPERDQEWYEVQKTDIYHRTGSLDDLYEQYPATDAEALAARTLDKRIAPQWLIQCYAEMSPFPTSQEGEGMIVSACGRVAFPISPQGGKRWPAIPGLEIFKLPEPGRSYVVGVDPAEGNPTSDDSAIEILDKVTGEEVASLAGKFEPSIIGAHADQLAQWYNNASVLVERNNHGHATLLWLKDNSYLVIVAGDDGKPGWLDSTRGKALLFDNCADAFRTGDTTVHSETTYTQLASIEGASLSAPQGEADDLAFAFALALMARVISGGPPAGENVEIPLAEYRQENRRLLWQRISRNA